jgi:hypothetical protein
LGKRNWIWLLPAVASVPIDELAQNVLATYILFCQRKHDPLELLLIWLIAVERHPYRLRQSGNEETDD